MKPMWVVLHSDDTSMRAEWNGSSLTNITFETERPEGGWTAQKSWWSIPDWMSENRFRWLAESIDDGP